MTTAAPAGPDAPPGTGRATALAAEVGAVAVVAALVAMAFLAEPLGLWDGDVHQWLPPLSAHWQPELHGWLLVALATGVATVAYGPRLAQTLPWRGVVGLTWATTVLWGVGLALGRGWNEAFVLPLDNVDEYLTDVDRAQAMGPLTVIREYEQYILLAADDHWTTHNSGHPPLPLLFYSGLDAVGLGGPVASGIVTGLVGSTAVVAVLLAVRLLGDEARAREAAPFLALSPMVIWVWISADGAFAAVCGFGIVLLALAATSEPTRRLAWLSVVAGLVLGLGLFLSYGLVLMAPVALGVLVAARRWQPAVPTVLAVLGVVAGFAALGFWWYSAQQTLVVRYYEGKGLDRPFGYWVWGNLAAVAVALGPAVWASLGAAAAQVVRRPRAVLLGRSGAAWLAAGALVAITAADLSHLSKSEVERIWLPFTAWLPLLAAWLHPSHRRAWLALQAVWAVGVCVLFRTTW